jgi:hypothetical protein
MDYTTAPAPVHVLQQDRYIRLYWPQDADAEPDEHGCTTHHTLTLEHADKTYRATESTAQASFSGGTHREAITYRCGYRRVIAQVPAARFSAARFLAFTQGVLGPSQAR